MRPDGSQVHRYQNQDPNLQKQEENTDPDGHPSHEQAAGSAVSVSLPIHGSSNAHADQTGDGREKWDYQKLKSRTPTGGFCGIESPMDRDRIRQNGHSYGCYCPHDRQNCEGCLVLAEDPVHDAGGIQTGLISVIPTLRSQTRRSFVVPAIRLRFRMPTESHWTTARTGLMPVPAAMLGSRGALISPLRPLSSSQPRVPHRRMRRFPPSWSGRTRPHGARNPCRAPR